MRLSSFLPLTLLVAAASLAVARPTDSFTYATRGDADLSLSARDLNMIELVARDYLSNALFARTDEPQREHYKTQEEYHQAWLAWNRNNRKLDHGMQKLLKGKNLDQPQREHYGSHEEYEKAWKDWNRQNRKIDHGTKKLLDEHAKQAHKDQQKASETKKQGVVGKALGKLKGKK